MSDQKIKKNFKSYKVALLGESGVGKTSIINKYVHGKFETSVLATAGVGFFNKEMTIPETNETFNLEVIIIILIIIKFKLYRYGIQQAKKDIEV